MSPLLWSLVALGAPSDLSVTSLGLQGARAESLGGNDPDLLLGQRWRWGMADDLTFLGDGRFTIDTDSETTWEQSRVRTLGIALEGQTTLLAGRHSIRHGGPRLLDGLQVLAHPVNNPQLDLGGWVGLMPDPFDTQPLIRPGLGPTLAINGSTLSASALGELVFGSGGLDRVGALLQARGNWAPTLFLNSRLDWLLTDAQGRSGLADGAASVTYRPSDALTLDATYNAFSTLRYQTTGILDPTVRRFQQRVVDLGLDDPALADTLDPTIQQSVGAGVKLRPDGGGVQPVLGLSGQHRAHPVPEERFTRVGPQLGLIGLLSGRLELLSDLQVLLSEGRLLSDAGINAIWELSDSGAVLIDTSARAMIDPVGYGEARPGWYADLFVDGVTPSSTVIALGVSWTAEPSDVVGTDVGWAGFLRLQQWIRPGRGSAPAASRSGRGGPSPKPPPAPVDPDADEDAGIPEGMRDAPSPSSPGEGAPE